MELPRSVRWRLQLGLLHMPDGGDGGAREEDSESAFLESFESTNYYTLQDQRERYDYLFRRYDPFRYPRPVTEQRDTSCSAASNDFMTTGSGDENDDTNRSSFSVDPLTHLMMEEEAREANEKRLQRQRRKASMVETNMSQEILQVVKKDLNRLHDEHASYYKSRANWMAAQFNNRSTASEAAPPLDFEQAVEERNELLTQILHIYGRAHVLPGYQQGMHEICSYVMFVMEMDLFDLETQDCIDYQNILTDEYLAHDVFTVTEAILTKMEHAYGFDAGGHLTPVEEMGKSILSKVQYVARDKKLYNHLQHMDFHLELYCARWVRLLFTREAGGWRNVLTLWDIFFDCISANRQITSMPTSKYTRPGLHPPLQLGKFDLMTVLETTAASLLWLSRDYLLSRQPDEALQLLCSSVDPKTDQRPLISTLLSSLRRLQISSNMAPMLPPKQRHVFNRRGSFSGGLNLQSIVTDASAPMFVTSAPRQAILRRSSLQHVSAREAAAGAGFTTFESSAAQSSPPTAEHDKGLFGSVMSSLDAVESMLLAVPLSNPLPSSHHRMRRRSSLQHVALNESSFDMRHDFKEENPGKTDSDGMVWTITRTLTRFSSMRSGFETPLDLDCYKNKDFTTENNNSDGVLSTTGRAMTRFNSSCLELDTHDDGGDHKDLKHENSASDTTLTDSALTGINHDETEGNQQSVSRKANMELLLRTASDLDQSSLFRQSEVISPAHTDLSDSPNNSIRNMRENMELLLSKQESPEESSIIQQSPLFADDK